MGLLEFFSGKRPENNNNSKKVVKTRKISRIALKKISGVKRVKKPEKTKEKKYVSNVKKQKKGSDKSKIKLTSKEEKKSERGYLKTFVPGFDILAGEGIPIGNAVLVEGGPGSGKTIFCVTLLKEMCERGKKVLYMSFEEPEVKLKEHMKIFGVRTDEYEKKKLLYVKRFNALDIARSVEALLSEAKKELLIDVQPVLIPQDFEPDIVLIDSLSSIASAFSGEQSRFRIYMEQLFRYLEAHNITSFLIREVSNPTHVGNVGLESGEAVSFLSDGIIVIYNVFYKSGPRKRALEILKMRGSNVDRRVVECEIKKGQGLVVCPNKVLKGDYVLT